MSEGSATTMARSSSASSTVRSSVEFDKTYMVWAGAPSMETLSVGSQIRSGRTASTTRSIPPMKMKVSCGTAIPPPGARSRRFWIHRQIRCTAAIAQRTAAIRTDRKKNAAKIATASSAMELIWRSRPRTIWPTARPATAAATTGIVVTNAAVRTPVVPRERRISKAVFWFP